MNKILYVLVLILAFSCGGSEKPKEIDKSESNKWLAELEFILGTIEYETKNYKYINDSISEIDVYFIHPFLEIPVRYKYEIIFDNNDVYDSILSKKIIKKEALVNGEYKESVQEKIITTGTDTLDLSENPFG